LWNEARPLWGESLLGPASHVAPPVHGATTTPTITRNNNLQHHNFITWIKRNRSCALVSWGHVRGAEGWQVIGPRAGRSEVFFLSLVTFLALFFYLFCIFLTRHTLMQYSSSGCTPPAGYLPLLGINACVWVNNSSCWAEGGVPGQESNPGLPNVFTNAFETGL
jgi:hypothetical protein